MIMRPEAFRGIPGGEPPREPTDEERDQVMGFFLARHRDNEPQLDDFKDVIPETEIARDREYVRTRESQFEKKAGTKSKFLEALFASTEVAEANWFGSEDYPLFMVQTTRLDDIANGVDLVWEWKTPDGIVRLAVDVTVSDSEERLIEKLQKVQSELTGQTLGKVKYFASEIHGGGRGSVRGLPHVVVGTDSDGVDRLIAAFAPIPRIDRRLTALTEADAKRHLTQTEKAEKKALEDELEVTQRRLERDPIIGIVFLQMQEQLANQVIDEVALFFRRHELRAFRGEKDEVAHMETVAARLRNLMDRFASGEDYMLERIEFFEALEPTLAVMKTQDATIGKNMEQLLGAYRFIMTLQEIKRSASGIVPSSGKRSKTHEVLTRPWLEAPRFPGYLDRAA